MLVGYVFWLLGSLGFLGNTVGGILFSMLIVAGLGLWAYLSRSDRVSTLQSWFLSHSLMVPVAELLFVSVRRMGSVSAPITPIFATPKSQWSLLFSTASA
jgi:hypothetical protein